MILGLISGILHGNSSGMHHDRVISDTKKLRFQTAPADLLQCLMLQSKGGVHMGALSVMTISIDPLATSSAP